MLIIPPALAAAPPEQPKLQISITQNDNFPALGDVITYTITMQNNSDDAANAAEMTNILPAGPDFVLGSMQGSMVCATMTRL